MVVHNPVLVEHILVCVRRSALARATLLVHNPVDAFLVVLIQVCGKNDCSGKGLTKWWN
jgi:hypothetical protein